jgi:hypothetical protein
MLGVRRSYSSLSRWGKKAGQWWAQALAGPSSLAREEEFIFRFDQQQQQDAKAPEGWRVMTDKGIGGSSSASVEVRDGSFMRFSGRLCAPFEMPLSPAAEKKLRKLEEQVAHEEASNDGDGDGDGDRASGAARVKSAEKSMRRISNAFSVLQTEKGLLQRFDFEPYRSLLLKVRGDGRKYVVSLRTENWIIPGTVSDDVYQGYIQPTKGQWEEILLPFDKFLLTWQGKVLNDQLQMNHRNLFSMSFASIGLLPSNSDEVEKGENNHDDGDASTKKNQETETAKIEEGEAMPFSLDVAWVKATVME